MQVPLELHWEELLCKGKLPAFTQTIPGSQPSCLQQQGEELNRKVCPAVPEWAGHQLLALTSSQSQMLLNQLDTLLWQLWNQNAWYGYGMSLHDHAILLPGKVMPSPLVENSQYLERVRKNWSLLAILFRYGSLKPPFFFSSTSRCLLPPWHSPGLTAIS